MRPRNARTSPRTCSRACASMPCTEFPLTTAGWNAAASSMPIASIAVFLKKTAMEAIGIEEAAAFQPAVVRGNSVHGIEAQALEHVRGDVRAFLGRIDRYRMQGVELGGDHSKQTELHADHRLRSAVPRPLACD